MGGSIGETGGNGWQVGRARSAGLARPNGNSTRDVRGTLTGGGWRGGNREEPGGGRQGHETEKTREWVEERTKTENNY